MRLNKFLASCGLGSRRGCEALISKGAVKVNDRVCRELATQITESDKVEYGGRLLSTPKAITIAFHKPAGFVTTASDEFRRKTVFDLLPKEFSSLRYVGRLDRETEGLLLLTSSGDLVNELTHPARKIEKQYIAFTDKPFDERDIPRLLAGVETPEGIGTAVAAEKIMKRKVAITLTQGMKHQVRNMFAGLGYKVKRLIRIRVGTLELGTLAPGKWRRLNDEQVAHIAAR
ncbi:pseudouridine synthase [soil metagenome]